MSVSYNSKKIIPAPFLSIQRESISREDGAPLGAIYSLTVRGKLVAYKGSPNSTGVLWDGTGYPPDEVIPAESRLTALLRKQEALKKLFSEDGYTFEVQGWDGETPLKCNPRIKRIDFQEGQWYETCEYIITMEADCVEGLVDSGLCDNSPKVSKVSEEWNIEILDENQKTYRLSHSVSATGKRMFDDTGALLNGKEAWENARDYVLNTNGDGIGLGLVAERMQAPGVLDANSLQAYNYIRSQSINESSGVFSATETWLCYDPDGQAPAINDYTITMRYNAQDNKTTVTVDGTITGLEVRNNTTGQLVSTKWSNANSKWQNNVSPNIFSTAQSAVGLSTSLNSIPLSKQVGINEIAGTITYNWEYDNRPNTSIGGAITESITITDSNAADVFAQVPVLGRPYGPVLQSMSTITARRRTVSIEIQMPPSTQGYTASAPNTNSLVLSYKPPGGIGVFLESDEESWTPNTGRYTRTTIYVWE